MPESDGWTSLEIARLAVSALTPLLLVYLGYVVNRAGRRVEEAQWLSRKLIDRRFDLYDEMAPDLNDLYCFVALVGRFKDITPPEAIALKRRLDQSFFVNRFLFSPTFGRSYQEFIGVCFEPYAGGFGHDALLRTSAQRQRKERGETWDPEWDRLFTQSNPSTQAEVVSAYERLMNRFADELGLRGDPRRRRPTRPSGFA